MLKSAGAPAAGRASDETAADERGGAASKGTWAYMRNRLRQARQASAPSGSGDQVRVPAASQTPARSETAASSTAQVPVRASRQPPDGQAAAAMRPAPASAKVAPASAANGPAENGNPPSRFGKRTEPAVAPQAARTHGDVPKNDVPKNDVPKNDVPKNDAEIPPGPTPEARRKETASSAAPPTPEPRPAVGEEAGALLGRVISVAGSNVWGRLEPKVSNACEIGSVVRLKGSGGRTFGLITALKSEGRRGGDDSRLIEIKMLGEIPSTGPSAGRFRKGVSSHPALDSAIHAAGSDELRAMYARPETSTVRLGTLHHTADLPAYAITDNLLGKHFAVLGTTGAGKSCAVTVILRAILDSHPFGHVVMLDPHNEYAQAFVDRAELLNPASLKLPYWLLNFEELASILVNSDSPERAYAEGAILKSALLEARRKFFNEGETTDHVTVDTPVPYRLSELAQIIRDAMGAFNKPESSAPYQHLMQKIESVGNDKRYEFMFSSFLVRDNMRQVLARILRIPVDGKPITIIDISGVPSEIVDVVVSVLCRLIFEFAVWGDRKRTPPILLVCEEAHRYVPREDQQGFAPTRRSISRIAKEGRKYGLALCLVTQRPAELSISSLSQCNTIFALRLGNEHDLEFVRHAVPDSSRWMIDSLPALNTQEALVLGDGVPVPMHIRFDQLDAEHRPASTSPSFAKSWRREVEDGGLIAEAVERWRYQIRGPRQADPERVEEPAG
jgi:DNA helicase HerA-like ATPase